MIALAVVLAAAIGTICAIVAPAMLRRRRRSRLIRTPVAPALRALMHASRAWRRLPPDMQPLLEDRIRVFLAEQTFTGCQGLSVTESMRVEIASQACLLLLGRPQRVYDQLRSILVYPDDFLVPRREVEDEVVTEFDEHVTGLAWDTSSIILSWGDIEAGDPLGNTVLHEFAHYLDHEEGATDAAAGGDAARRVRALQAAYARFDARHTSGEESLLDEAALDDLIEFFAFATESFFEAPQRLADEDPALYAELSRYYGLDPGAW